MLLLIAFFLSFLCQAEPYRVQLDPIASMLPIDTAAQVKGRPLKHSFIDPQIRKEIQQQKVEEYLRRVHHEQEVAEQNVRMLQQEYGAKAQRFKPVCSREQVARCIKVQQLLDIRCGFEEQLQILLELIKAVDNTALYQTMLYKIYKTCFDTSGAFKKNYCKGCLKEAITNYINQYLKTSQYAHACSQHSEGVVSSLYHKFDARVNNQHYKEIILNNGYNNKLVHHYHQQQKQTAFIQQLEQNSFYQQHQHRHYDDDNTHTKEYPLRAPAKQFLYECGCGEEIYQTFSGSDFQQLLHQENINILDRCITFGTPDNFFKQVLQINEISILLNKEKYIDKTMSINDGLDRLLKMVQIMQSGGELMGNSFLCSLDKMIDMIMHPLELGKNLYATALYALSFIDDMGVDTDVAIKEQRAQEMRVVIDNVYARYKNEPALLAQDGLSFVYDGILTAKLCSCIGELKNITQPRYAALTKQLDRHLKQYGKRHSVALTTGASLEADVDAALMHLQSIEKQPHSIPTIVDEPIIRPAIPTVLTPLEMAEKISPAAKANYLKAKHLIDKVCEPQFFTEEKLAFFAERAHMIEVEIPQVLERISLKYPEEAKILKIAKFDHTICIDSKNGKKISGFHFDPNLNQNNKKIYSLENINFKNNGVIVGDVIFEKFPAKETALFPLHWNLEVLIENLAIVLKDPDLINIQPTAITYEKMIDNVKIRVVIDKNKKIITFYPLKQE